MEDATGNLRALVEISFALTITYMYQQLDLRPISVAAGELRKIAHAGKGPVLPLEGCQ